MSSTPRNTSKSSSGRRKCVHCGAEVLPNATKCWLCLAPITEAAEVSHQRQVPDPSSSSFSLASLLMFMTLASVVLGVFSLWPGVGVPLGVIMLAVWARTAANVRKRVVAGEEVSSLQKVLMFLTSFATTTGILLLLIVTGGAAAFTAFAAICMATEPQANEIVPWFFGGAAIAGGGIASLVYVSRRLRRGR